MRISPPGTDEDRLDAREVGEVVSEGLLHGLGVACEGEVVGLETGVYEVVNFGEWVGGDDVDGSEGLRQPERR